LRGARVCVCARAISATRSGACGGEVNAVIQELLNCMVWLLKVARVPCFFRRHYSMRSLQ